MTKAVNTALAGAGGVLQVVTTSSTTSFSTSSTTYIDTISLSITPSSTSSRILIIPSLCLANAGASGPDGSMFVRLFRGSTALFESTQRTYWYSGAGVYLITPGSMVYADSPAASSSTTYKVQIRAGATTAYLNADGGASSLTLLEIAG